MYVLKGTFGYWDLADRKELYGLPLAKAQRFPTVSAALVALQEEQGRHSRAMPSWGGVLSSSVTIERVVTKECPVVKTVMETIETTEPLG